MEIELKFRAWSPERNGFVTNCFPIGYQTKEGFQLCGVGEGEYCQDTEDDGLIIQQYTGVNDKNGKDVYDGDIIKDTLTGAIMRVHFGYNRNGNYTGWYCSYLNIDHNGNCSLSNDDDRDYNSQIEVIGNAFENPDLL